MENKLKNEKLASKKRKIEGKTHKIGIPTNNFREKLFNSERNPCPFGDSVDILIPKLGISHHAV